jgi:4-alpha-glucanotransferase
MRFDRACGTLVHPTSFPSDFGIGDLGSAAYTFIRFLESTHQSIWQILPLGPTGYGNSPYASYSAFAGNAYLISPEILLGKGLLTQAEVDPLRIPSGTRADYDAAYAIKDRLFDIASKRFYDGMTAETKAAFAAFQDENAYWLADYARFMAGLLANGKQPWNLWDKKTLTPKKLRPEIDKQLFLQFEFFNQWAALKRYANERGVKVVGDIPIFVDHNSADVWSHPDYFEVDAAGNRVKVAGVPPDYFSATGQLWGNPLYKWKVLESDGYSWWIERFRQMFRMFDLIRVDHFRGFDAYWEVDAKARTAEHGRWVKGPGMRLFDTILRELGDIPVIAEDLGVITPSVVALRDRFGFPGMKILQFSFTDNQANAFLPHNYHTANCVVYTGTHDNDTTIGWYRAAPDIEKHRAREYTRSDGTAIHWELIRLGMMSVADQAIFPLQDFMGLGTEHRMNFPGTTENNWLWRFTPEMLGAIPADPIRHIVHLSNRNPRLQMTDANLVELAAEDP